MAALGPNFRLLVIASIILGSAATVGINSDVRGWTSNYQLFLEWTQAPAGRLLLFLVSASNILTGCLTVLITSNGLNSLRLAREAGSGRENFRVILHGQEFDEHRLARTLGEFNQARTETNKTFPEAGKAALVSLHLYPDMESYHERTGLTLSQGSMQCLPNGASISAPLERIPNLITGSDGSKTPIHEMSHATVCQVLGPAFHQLPDWFHEGTAEWVRTELEPRTIRAFNRMRVWLAGSKNAPSPQDFCSGPPGETSQERKRFYMTATEFVRFLESKHGSGSLNEIIHRVGEGSTFEESMRDKFGDSCQELYARWLKTW